MLGFSPTVFPFSQRRIGNSQLEDAQITRMPNAFSNRREAYRMACALHFGQYNSCRIHQSLRLTLAMEAELVDHVWSLAEIVGLLEAEEEFLAFAA